MMVHKQILRIFPRLISSGQKGKKWEFTLAIVKPDATANPIVVKSIREEILKNGFLFVRSNMLRLTNSQAAQFYIDHKDKFFYNRLITFMTSGPICTHILAREDAVSEWRKLMGPTKSYRAQYEAPQSIRGRFGLSDTRNAVHGSDSWESAAREINFYFPDFDGKNWLREHGNNFFNAAFMQGIGRADSDEQNLILLFDEQKCEHYYTVQQTNALQL